MFLKYGLISELGAEERLGFVRVRFPADDDLVSPWMPLLFRWTKTDQEWGLPAMGEHVACMVDEHVESGVVLGALYSETDSPAIASPTVWAKSFEDGTVLSYDKETQTLQLEAQGPLKLSTKGQVSITVEGDAEVSATGKATLQAEEFSIDCASGKHVKVGGGSDLLVKKSWMTALEAKVDAIDQAIGPAFSAVLFGPNASGDLGKASYELAMVSARASYTSGKADGATTKLKGG